MPSEIDYVDFIDTELHRGEITFHHSPTLWDSLTVPTDLHWSAVRFDEANQECVPSDKFGVYAFLLKPNIVGPPPTGYLLYVGETDRDFRVRYGEYMSKQRTRKLNRMIDRMLNKWVGHVWFYYAPIEECTLLKPVEEALMNACVPPAE